MTTPSGDSHASSSPDDLDWYTQATDRLQSARGSLAPTDYDALRADLDRARSAVEQAQQRVTEIEQGNSDRVASALTAEAQRLAAERASHRAADADERDTLLEQTRAEADDIRQTAAAAARRLLVETRNQCWEALSGAGIDELPDELREADEAVDSLVREGPTSN